MYQRTVGRQRSYGEGIEVLRRLDELGLGKWLKMLLFASDEGIVGAHLSHLSLFYQLDDIVGYKSAVAKASSKSPSLRTTIPQQVVEEASIKRGDILDWEVITEGGRKIMKVRRLE